MSTQPDHGIERIGQIALTAHDLDRAIAFYRDVLGLPFLFQAGQLAFFNCGGVRLLIETPQDPQYDHPGSILYYLVQDLQASHAALQSRGAEVVGEPHLIAKMPDHDLWMSFYKDSEGNTFALMSEVRPPA